MAASSGSAACIRGLEELRDFRASVYGRSSRLGEDSTRELAASHAESGQWHQAAKLYLDVADISELDWPSPGRRFRKNLEEEGLVLEFASENTQGKLAVFTGASKGIGASKRMRENMATTLKAPSTRDLRILAAGRGASPGRRTVATQSKPVIDCGGPHGGFHGGVRLN
jgi:hypothetical protein